MKHTCNLCSHTIETRCNEEKHQETGFSTLHFTQFTSECVFGLIADGSKEYYNRESTFL